jgi:hypothetical protein
VVAVRSTAPPLATVTTDDTSILTVENLIRGANQIFMVDVLAPDAGDTDVVVRDAAGTEIDRLTFHVRATDVLGLSRPWGAGDALVLAGEVERLHVTTITAGVVSAGVGAVQFTLAGDLSTATNNQAPWLLSEGDEAFFRTAASGSGSITASAPNATTTVNIRVVPPASLAALTADPSSLDVSSNRAGVVAIGALSGSAPVYGARCTWSDVGQLTVALNSGEQTGWIGSSPVFLYSIYGPPGMYSPTCTIGGLTTTLSVRIR